jgi:hypothetical protein
MLVCCLFAARPWVHLSSFSFLSTSRGGQPFNVSIRPSNRYFSLFFLLGCTCAGHLGLSQLQVVRDLIRSCFDFEEKYSLVYIRGSGVLCRTVHSKLKPADRHRNYPGKLKVLAARL